jgi:hypothetical protein
MGGTETKTGWKFNKSVIDNQHGPNSLKKASILLKNVNYAPFVLFRQFSLKFKEKSKQIEAAHLLNIPFMPIFDEAVIMLEEGQQSKFRIILRAYGSPVGFIVLFLWVAVLAASLILYVLGFKVPEMLISTEAQISALGYCWLLSEFYIPRRRSEKHYRLLTFLGLTVGIILIITGVYNAIHASLNIFTYLCFITGTSLIFINAKQIRYALKRP